MQATQRLSSTAVVIVDLGVDELTRSERACACLAHVRLKVARMESLSSAGTAHQLRTRAGVVPAFIERPVALLETCPTTAASKLGLACLANQAAFLSRLLFSLGVVEYHPVEHVAAEMS